MRAPERSYPLSGRSTVSTAVALQPWIQWTDLTMDESLLHGMCLIEGTLVSNESSTSQTDRAVRTGQCTLNAQDIDQLSNYMSNFTLLSLQIIAVCCSRL